MTVPLSHFDALYSASPDPWGFTSRWYEQRKYAVTLAALPERRYGSAYEPGCSIGVLTALLAERCDALLASDGSAAAVELARGRLAGQPNVQVEQRWLPDEWPTGSYDLVVLSELLYFLDSDDLDAVLADAVAAVAPGGTLVAVHWRPPADDHPLPTDAVHARLLARAAGRGLTQVVHHLEDEFVLDVVVRGARHDQPSLPRPSSPW